MLSERDPGGDDPLGNVHESASGSSDRTAADLTDRPAWERALWVLAGLSFVGIGAVGIVVPGLPTTPLLLLAAACFARSSPRLYRWLLNNRTFGPLIQDYRAGRGVSLRVKVTAISIMATFVTFALLVPLRGKPIVSAAVGIAAVGGALFIMRIPTRVPQGMADQGPPDT